MLKRVLLIEDEPNIIEALRFVLGREGLAVDTQSDGAGAMDALERRRPDVIVLDVMLPNRSGFEILRDIRANEDHAQIPVLMLTARGQEKDRQLAESLGATAFMTKPFSNTEVLKTIQGLLPS